jgi:hypothetical protein
VGRESVVRSHVKKVRMGWAAQVAQSLFCPKKFFKKDFAFLFKFLH